MIKQTRSEREDNTVTLSSEVQYVDRLFLGNVNVQLGDSVTATRYVCPIVQGTFLIGPRHNGCRSGPSG